MKLPSSNNSSLRRLLAGWCGLMLYVAMFSPIGMGVASLLGTIDPDHHAILQPGAGGMRLVLHHEGNCSGHRHSVVARALTVFARPASANDPDHILQFSSNNGFTRDTEIVVPDANQSEPFVIHFAEPIAFGAVSPIQFNPPPRPPPDIVGNLLYFSSTVLLI